MTNYFSKFTRKYSDATYPLLQLLKKNVRWEWTEETSKQFEKIKRLFCDTVVIHHPDPKGVYYLQCDASNYAIGAVLYQLDDTGDQLIVGVMSRTLKGAELNYFTTEKELLAIVAALEKFRTFIIGARLIVRTDHKALTFVLSCRLLNSRLSRWVLLIQSYGFDIEHVKGSENIVADTLSRNPPENQQDIETIGQIKFMGGLGKEISKELRDKFRELGGIQKANLRIADKIREEGIKESGRIEIKNGICYHIEKNGKSRAYVPESMIKQLITECHEIYGHVGAAKCYRMLSHDFYYPKLAKTVRQEIARCDRCQRCKVPNRYSYAKMQNIIPDGVGELVSIDFFGPLPPSQGNYRWLIVAIDAFSKFTKLYPLKTANAQSTIRCIFDEYIPELGKPRRIQFDHGTQFTSNKWLNKLKEEGIIPVFSSIRHPQGNIVERVNREIARFFRTFLTDKHTTWVKWLKTIETCMNEVHHDTTEFAPCELQLNEKPKRFWAEWVNNEGIEQARDLKITLAKRNIIKKGKARASKFNKEHKMCKFNVGDLVLLRALNVSDTEKKKMAKLFEIYEGPYRLKRQVGEATYVLENPIDHKERGRFHVSMFKLYIS